ncbi:LysM domain-containing protein [Bdellovibrio sp. NC01]|uniref:LysM peptidoglycan-binding domain-containing protein n=1 Tax=Bdellovibrio sp. NC01 TaxID=2220073 RepID=UPI00115826B9|nr:LysM domain-containing protein [Bdellovibrio sp. NC01]QDK36154.1 hypothetical protein DOE51_00315 [Bdellovibrio sp. NC01]
MMKKLVVLLACCGLAVQLSGCSLFSSENKSDAEVTADVDSADLEKLEGEEALQATNDQSLASDQLPEDALGESAPKAEPQAIAAAPAESLTPPASTSNESLPSDPFAENAATEMPPPPAADSNTTIVDSGTTSNPETVPMVESTTRTETHVVEEAPKKPAASLQKVATAPWQVGKTWYNTVYFARPGDSLASISQMIYGADKTAELKKGNPSLKSRKVKPGDKVYYNSPHRPDDSARMVTYYEDNGMAPETYIAKSGDNIRKVSKNLLGYSDAWKEVWASNSVDSKGVIPEGTELHYWKGGQQVAAAPAMNEMPHGEIAQPQHQDMGQQAPPPPMPEQPQQQAQMDIPPPPPMPEAQPPAQEMAPPPPPPDMAQNQMAPPPPPPMEAVNPPPPPPKKHQVEEAPAGGMDNDTTLALAVVGLAAAGLAGLIVMRKKRKQKEAEQQAMDNTHVGT